MITENSKTCSFSYIATNCDHYRGRTMNFCTCCEKKFLWGDPSEEIEHYRVCKKLGLHLVRPNKVGVKDAHGWTWYCFECHVTTAHFYKNHRSFTDTTMLDHLFHKHKVVTTAQKKKHSSRSRDIEISQQDEKKRLIATNQYLMLCQCDPE